MTNDILNDCIFCKIAAREIPSPLLWDDEDIVAFNDISPLAPVHVLIIPRKHISDLNQLTEDDMQLIGKINYVATVLADKAGIANSGWRLVCNCGENGGQEVFHLHYHLLGGKYLGPFIKK
jgi:histidine triad (HIT) family protein